MDRGTVAQLDPDRIPEALEGRGWGERWKCLDERAGDAAPHVLKLVCRVVPPERMSQLRDLETEQAERGAGFLGMLPDQIPDDLDVPDDLEASLDAAIRLSEIRAANLAALAEAMPQYPVSFVGGTFDSEPAASVPPSWRVDVDVDGIRAVLGLFDASEPDADTAAIARMPAFVEMMRHRRELGYVPEPLIDEEGVAWCLLRAASRDPIDALWTWLPSAEPVRSERPEGPPGRVPMPDRSAFARDDKLATRILGCIAPYAPPGTVFADRLSFAVGWGIRGWATQSTGGMNIEHAKDDFEFMLPTLVHETFHRLQAKIALADPQIEEIGFDRITSYPLESPADCRLYQALCCAMLEGSAAYVASPGPLKAWAKDAKAGLKLLDRIRAIDASSDGADKSGELLNEGLRSNGPFYGFGALMSHVLVEDGGGTWSLGVALGRGAP